MRPFSKGTSLVSLMSYSSDVYTYIFLNYEVRTCDGIYNRCILVRLTEYIKRSPSFKPLVYVLSYVLLYLLV
jgi:hypothetical protein